jgi:hypothetical protein
MQLKKFTVGTLLALPLLLLSVGGAWASTPANTLIRNTATLTGTGLPAEGITASVEVKIDLVAQKPTLSRPTVLTQMPDNSSAAENAAVTVSYRLTTNANGPDTFVISQESYTAVNLSGDSGAATYTLTSIPLGATAVAATAAVGATSITVPYDGTGSGAGGTINGIAQNTLIRIGDYDYTVASVAENPATNLATINLTPALQAAVDQGDPIREYQLFEMKIANSGTVTTGGDPAYLDVSTRATSQANNTLFDADSTTNSAGNASDGHRTNVVSIAFNKYVRNDSNTNGSGAFSTFYGQNFYPTTGAVTAAPGNVLEYALVITTSAAGLTGGIVTDTVPAFTTYQPGSFAVNNTPVADGGTLPLIAGYPLGAISGAQTIVITFQVKVNE